MAYLFSYSFLVSANPLKINIEANIWVQSSFNTNVYTFEDAVYLTWSSVAECYFFSKLAE